MIAIITLNWSKFQYFSRSLSKYSNTLPGHLCSKSPMTAPPKEGTQLLFLVLHFLLINLSLPPGSPRLWPFPLVYSGLVPQLHACLIFFTLVPEPTIFPFLPLFLPSFLLPLLLYFSPIVIVLVSSSPESILRPTVHRIGGRLAHILAT